MKKYCILLILAISCVSCARQQMNPALAIQKKFIIIEEDNYIVPYFLNLFSIRNLMHEREIEKIKNYITWYLERVNYPDMFGITGSKYDYRITSEGLERPTVDFDSIDSYSGTFLVLLNSYIDVTNDRELIAGYYEKIRDIAYTIIFLMDTDGLTIAHPGFRVKYLMNNCEAYWGLAAYVDLCRNMGWEIDGFYLQSKGYMKKKILEEFYDAEEDNFYWAIAGEQKHKSDWSIFYPDAYAQIFPIFTGIIEGEKALNLYNEFQERYGKDKDRYPIEQRIVMEINESKIKAYESERLLK